MNSTGEVPSFDVSNVLNEEKKKQVIALGQLGWSLRQIEKATGIRRETAGGYLRAAGIGLRPPGGWGKRAPPKPANGVTTDSPAAKPANEVTADASPVAGLLTPSETSLQTSPATAASASEPYRELIENGLAPGRNAMSIWQEMVDRHGFTGAYESVKRFVRKLRGPSSPEARAVITTPPGEEAQVDYGTGPTIRDPHTGKYRRSRRFVLTLGYSRKCVRLLTFQSSTRIWAELHERAFRRLGGAVKIIVPDNLGEGVLKPDIYDATLNPLYATYSLITARKRCLAALPIQIAKAKWKVASDTPRKLHSKDSASKVWRKRRPTWISGRRSGPTLAFTARRSAR